mgnify:FL=1
MVERAWRAKSVVWLAGVRRSGKTVLARQLGRVRYFDCESPRVRRECADPEAFLASQKTGRVVLDEVHRLDNPSELLKLAADHFPGVRLLATGSSTLGASRKFRDTLAGRKAVVWLTPMAGRDLVEFRGADLNRRMVRGGLPSFFLSKGIPEASFQDWMDAYWAKDIEELFRLERRSSFQKFTELIMARSGGLFEGTEFARTCEINRATALNYLAVLEQTFVAHVVRAYSTRKTNEILASPKVYGFDTGFVCYYRGVGRLAPEDAGRLWEHLVLNELHAGLQTRRINHWRDKKGHEVDFVLPIRGGPPVAIECKWTSANADLSGLAAFARRYPEARLVLAAGDGGRAVRRSEAFGEVVAVGLHELIRHVRTVARGLIVSQFA